MSTHFTIEIEEGVPFPIEVLYEDDDGEALPIPDDTTVKMQGRRVSTGALLFEMTEDGGFEIDNEAGTITGEISVDDGIACPANDAEYDLFMFPPGEDPIKLIWGLLTKQGRVTT